MHMHQFLPHISSLLLLICIACKTLTQTSYFDIIFQYYDYYCTPCLKQHGLVLSYAGYCYSKPFVQD